MLDYQTLQIFKNIFSCCFRVLEIPILLWWLQVKWIILVGWCEVHIVNYLTYGELQIINFFAVNREQKILGIGEGSETTFLIDRIISFH